MAKSSKLVVFCIAFVLSLLGLGVVSIYRNAVGSESGELEARMAEAKRLGLPLEATDFDPKEPAAPEDIASTYLNQIVELQKKDTKLRLAAREINQFFGGQVTPPMAALLRELEPLTQLALRAAECKTLSTKRDWELGRYLRLPEFVVVKEAVKRLMLSAKEDAAAWRFESCVEKLTAIKKLSALMWSDPTLIAAMVGVALDAIGDAAVHKLASDHASNIKFLKMLLPLYNSELSVSRVVESVKGEVYSHIVLARNPQVIAFGSPVAYDENPAPQVDPKKLIRGGIPTSLLGRSVMSKALRVWNDAYRNQPQRIEDLGTWSNRMDTQVATFSSDQSRAGPLMDDVFPVFSHFADNLLDNVAKTRLIRAYLRILVDRAEGRPVAGILPETDPFSDEALRYKATKAGFKVWSVGTNRFDDGGTYDPRTLPNLDIVIEFPRPL